MNLHWAIYESKVHNSDFCNEFIYELNFYQFIYLNSLSIHLPELIEE